jgi:hypothetical protein
MEELKSTICEHANELVAFIYGELNSLESRDFQRHMQCCSSCSAELAAFGNIHSSMVAWRDESLGRVSSSTLAQSAATQATLARPSALAALREFFNLSPLWMKGAVAFASLLFVIFAGLAVTRLAEAPKTTVPTISAVDSSTTYSEQQLKAIVERRVQDELLRLKQSTDQLATTQGVSERLTGGVAVRRMTRNDVVTSSSPTRRPLSKVEREQLAADLRLVAVNNDGDLDLLDDRINQ